MICRSNYSTAEKLTSKVRLSSVSGSFGLLRQKLKRQTQDSNVSGVTICILEHQSIVVAVIKSSC